MNLQKLATLVSLSTVIVRSTVIAADWPGEFQSVLPLPTANLINEIVFEAGQFHVLGNLGTWLHS